MSSLLLVIDLQKGFVNEKTEYLVEKINHLIQRNLYDQIAFTRFINTPQSVLAKKRNYFGCMGEDNELVIDAMNCKVFEKDIYSAYNDELKKYIETNQIDQIYLCGLDTDACVLKTAFDLFENGYDVFVLKDYCASTGGEKLHQAALEVLKRNIGEDQVG